MTQDRLEELRARLHGQQPPPLPPEQGGRYQELKNKFSQMVVDPLSGKLIERQTVRDVAARLQAPGPDTEPPVDVLAPAKEAAKALGRGLYTNLPKTAAATVEGLASAAQQVPGPWSIPDLLKRQLAAGGVNVSVPTPLEAAQTAGGGVRQAVREAEEGGFLQPEKPPEGDFLERLKKDTGQTLVEAFLENTPQLVATVAATAASGGAGGLAAAFSLEFGNAYDQAKQDGADEGRATTAAILTAVPNAFLERIVPGHVVQKFGSSWPGVAKALKDIGIDMLMEGGTEGLQSFNQSLAQVATYAGDKGLTANDLKSLFSTENLRQYGSEAIIGALIAGPMSGAALASGAAGPVEGSGGAGVRTAETPPAQPGSVAPVTAGAEATTETPAAPQKQSSTEIDEPTRAGEIVQQTQAALRDLQQRLATGQISEVEAQQRLVQLGRVEARLTDQPLREMAAATEQIGEKPSPQQGFEEQASEAMKTLGLSRQASPPQTPEETGTSKRGVDQGPKDTVIAGDQDVPVRWAVVDVADLRPSHRDTGVADRAVLRPNPDYDPSLQPRQRTREASATQVTQMSQRLDPRRLAGSMDAGQGAPIVGPDLQVESGNARAVAIERAYRLGTERSNEYRDMVTREAEQRGLSTEGIAQPVLVRVREGELDPSARQELVRRMNEPAVSRMAGGEQAAADAQRLSDATLEGLNPTESGEISLANSPEAVQGFLRALPETEAAALRDPNGRLNQEGERRLTAAVLARALGNDEAVGRMVESTSSEIANLRRAVMVAAPEMAKQRQAMDAGTRIKDLDLAPVVAEVANELDSLRQQGKKVTDELAQGTIFGRQMDPETELLLRIAGGDTEAQAKYGLDRPAAHRSAKVMGQVLGRYVELVDAAGDPRQSRLGAVPNATRLSVLEEALRTATQQRSLPGTRAAASVGKVNPALVRSGKTLPLEIPELVGMVQEAGGGQIPIKIVQAIRSASGAAAGAFSTSKATIELRADLAKDPAQAAATLAHEVGHWIDYLPDKTLKRGNILGHIAALKKHLKGFLSTTSGRLSNKEVRSELWELSQKWRPLPKEASGKFLAYRKKATELYADAFSVLVNNPELLQQEAPLFARAWEDHLNARPTVARSWLDYQALVAAGPVAVAESRVDRVLAMVEKGDVLRQQDLLAKQAGNGQTFGQAISDGLIDRNGPVYRRVKAARKNGASLDPEANPIHWVEELPYFVSEASAYLALGKRNVTDLLASAGVSNTEFGALLGLRRAGTERAELWNPLGISGQDAEATYKKLEERLGLEKAAAAQSASEAFWQLRKSTVIDKLKTLQILSPDLEAKVASNAGYVRFQVQRFIEEAGKAGGGDLGLGALKEQVGTLQEIGNPLVETMLTDLALIRMAHRNAYARTLVEFEQNYLPGEITEAKRGSDGRFLSAPRDQGLVVYLHKGETKGFYLPKEVADTVDRFDPQNNLYNFWMRWAQNPFRTLVIERSLPFALFNMPKDAWSVYSKVIRGNPIKSAILTLKYYKRAARPAYEAAFRESLPPLEIEMLRRREIAAPGERFYKAGETGEETAIHALLSGYGLFAADETAAQKYWQHIERWLDKTPFSKKPGAFTERWAKMAAHLYLTDHQAELGLSDKQISHEVRTHGGTPDFYRRGKWFRTYNSLFTFSNVGKEGWRSDLEVGLDPKTRREYWQKRALWVLGPKTMMYAAAAGLMGEGLKKLFARISDHDKRNFMIIPWGMDANGNAVYTRVPYDHFGQFFSNLFWVALQSQEKPEDLANTILESAPYSPAALHPYLEIGIATSQYVSGRNPTDMYHGQPVVNPWTFDAQGPWSPESIRQYARWMWNTAGGRLLVDFQREDLSPKTELERRLQVPILGPVASRLLKVSDYGLYEEAKRRLGPVKEERSVTSLARRKMIEQNLAADKPLSVPELHSEMRKLGINYKSMRELKSRVDEIREQMQGGIPRLRAGASKEEKQILDALEKEMAP